MLRKKHSTGRLAWSPRIACKELADVSICFVALLLIASGQYDLKSSCDEAGILNPCEKGPTLLRWLGLGFGLQDLGQFQTHAALQSPLKLISLRPTTSTARHSADQNPEPWVLRSRQSFCVCFQADARRTAEEAQHREACQVSANSLEKALSEHHNQKSHNPYSASQHAVDQNP